MIPRYQRPAMTEHWNDASIFRQRLRVEAAVAKAQAHYNIIPQSAADAICEQAEQVPYDAKAIAKIEQDLRHDIVAMLTYFSEFLGPSARYLHFGMTSSDLIDTSLAVHVVKACDMIDSQCAKVLEAIKLQAFQHKSTLCMGRSHGIHAEPTTFGIKLAGHYAEFHRARNSLQDARSVIATCAISGAVGTYAHSDPRIEAFVAEQLGLSVETVSTQVIPRDRLARVFMALGLMASAMERLAIELRHLQRTEVSEVEESFGTQQTGSSAMPHKRNPISAENLTGIARLMRSYVAPAMENISLWHERDISHSSVERVIIPDSFMMLDYGLHRLGGLVKNLVVKSETMRNTVDRLGSIYTTQSIMLAMIDKGCSRASAYRAMQRLAHKAMENNTSFQDSVRKADEVLSYLSSDDLNKLFDPARYLRHTDTIFNRTFSL